MKNGLKVKSGSRKRVSAGKMEVWARWWQEKCVANTIWASKIEPFGDEKKERDQGKRLDFMAE